MVAIDAIECVGPSQARRFRRSGIRTTDALLRRAVTHEARCDLAARVSLTVAEILELALRVDLMRIKGVGARYSVLLNEAGVFTLEELGTQNADTLLAKIDQINDRLRLVRRLPNLDRVRSWVNEAGTLLPLVEH